MPSPFPGMDPYLESSFEFAGLRQAFVVFLEASLQPQLPDGYSASAFGRSVGTLDEDRHAEFYLDIRYKRGTKWEIVSRIEVLSLANKTVESSERAKYLLDQHYILSRGLNLVEIDLLRGGTHTTAVPEIFLRRIDQAFDYHVSIRRFEKPNQVAVYPILLERPLPTIPIPLLPGDNDVPIDLQAVFNRCYEAGPYSRSICYESVTPDPPLSPEQMAWAKDILSRRKT